MNAFNLIVFGLGLIIVLTGLVSRPMRERGWVSSAMVALGAGVLLGPAALALLQPTAWGDPNALLEGTARLTLAMGLMNIAVGMPVALVARHRRQLVVLLGILLPLMGLATGALVYAFTGMPFGIALLCGMVTGPTDPVVAAAISTGPFAERNLEAPLRHSLVFESELNDGLGLPFVALLALVLTEPGAEVWSDWLLHVLLWEVSAAAALGLALGAGAAWLFRRARAARRELRAYSALFTIGLALVVLGTAGLLGMSGILGVVAAGIALNVGLESDDLSEARAAQEAAAFGTLVAMFFLLGLLLPWARWAELGWIAPALAAAVLLLRRIPAVLLLRRWLSPLGGMRDALYFGWFGPIGVGALYYAARVKRHTGLDEPWLIGALLVFASVVVHGMSASPLTRLFGRLQCGERPETLAGAREAGEPGRE